MNYTGKKGLVVENEFAIGDTVYFVTDDERLPCIVTSIYIRPELLVYEVARGGTVSSAYNFEITKEKKAVTV